MKKLMLSLFMLLVLSGNSWAAILVMSQNGTYTTKTTLEAARTASDAANKTVVVTSPQSISGDMVWPSDRELVIETAGKLIFASGKKLTFATGSKTKFVTPEWFGGGAGVAAATNTTAIQNAIDTNLPVIIGKGTYDYVPPLKFTKDYCSIKGLGRYDSILKTTAVLASAIEISNSSVTSPIYGTVIENLQIEGNATNDNGIVIGAANSTGPDIIRAAVSTNIKDVRVTGFTNSAEAAGITIVNAWWVYIENPQLSGNFNGLYSPPTAISTTTQVLGSNSQIVANISRGVYLRGTMQDITFQNVSFEYAEKEAIYSVGAKSNITIRDCYFEQNSTSGTGTINIVGVTGTYDFTKVIIDNNYFHNTVSGGDVLLDYVKKSRVTNNDGFLSTPAITTTANSSVHLSNNKGHQAGDMMAQMRSSLGAVTGEEIDDTYGIVSLYGGRVIEGGSSTYGRYLHLLNTRLRSVQTTAPTVTIQAAAGTSASASVSATSTDIKGQITLNNGSGSWATGVQVLLTFNHAYDVAVTPPIVLLTPVGSDGQVYRPYVVESTNVGFYVAFGSAAASAATTKWNYIVIQ